MKYWILFLFFVTAAAAHGQQVDAPIQNFWKVTDGIYRGSRPADAKQIQFLAQLGVRTVIDLQGGDVQGRWVGRFVPYVEAGETPSDIANERKQVLKNGMRFFSKPLNSLYEISSAENLRIQEILSLMTDPANQPVYVHCAHGADRTGLIMALYRMQHQNWSAKEAYKEMYDKGHGAAHIAFTHHIDAYFLQKIFHDSVKQYFGIDLESGD